MNAAGALRALLAKLAGEAGARRSYWGSIATVMSGTIGAQAIGVVSMIVLARVYSPAEFGVFALFFAIAGLLSVLSTGKYEQALFVVKTPSEVSQVALLSLALCLTTALLVLALSPLAAFLPLDQGPHPTEFMALVALAVGTGGASLTLTSLATQRKAFKAVARGRLLQALSAAGVNLGLGLGGLGAIGLMWGLIAGQAALVLVLFSEASILRTSGVDWRAMTARARENSRFPRYMLISDLLNYAGANLVPFVTPAAFGAAPLGHYNMAQRVAGLPITIVGGALGEVFRSRISPQNLDAQHIHQLFRSTALRLAAIGLVFTAPLVVLGPWIFATVFGPEWREAGLYVQILSPVILGRFIASPLSSILMLGGRQRLDASLQGLFVVTAVLAFAVGVYLKSFLVMLAGISISHTLIYAVYLFCSYKVSQKIAHT